MVGRTRAVGGLHEGGGNCLKYLIRGWNRKEGRGNKDFQKERGKLGQGVSSLKGGGLEPPYELSIFSHVENISFG